MNTIDITPSPRILRTLGEIPFQPWQCLAELIDNSVDAIAKRVEIDNEIREKKVTVTWSSDNVAAGLRTIEILDTGKGMELAQLQNAARAGYSNNDPIHNLGLFGMGFNISTARLGENTKFLSTTIESKEWIGIEIDFAELIRSKSYAARVITMPKKNILEHGTKVIISRLKGDTYVLLRDQEANVRRQLENIYSAMLSKIDVDIYIQGKKLSPRRHCIWGESRFVTREGKHIPAVIKINRDLGASLFDIERNVYLSSDEQIQLQETLLDGKYPDNIVKRNKRLTGWVGIQRYADPNDFGIDFIRNGRKILISNKDLFSWTNPMTGTSKLEYPVELGTTVGGRIVGEIHVDYLIPTYQKNDFDRTDPSWMETIEALRGVGPILPRDRAAMMYTEDNSSPIGTLANAYRRVDPGTKCLYIDRTTSRAFLDRFRKNDPEFIDDDKWWQAAQEADRLIATHGAGNAQDVDTGASSSDDVDDYDPKVKVDTSKTIKPSIVSPPPVFNNTSVDFLLKNSKEIAMWSGPYSYAETPPLYVKVWELETDNIFQAGANIPCIFNQDGVECDFFYNPRHHFFSQYPVDPRQVLSMYLAEKFKARDRISDIGEIFISILQAKMNDVRVDRTSLQEKALAMFDRLRNKLLIKLSHRKIDVINCIHESNGEVEESVMLMLSNAKLIIKFQEKNEDGFLALNYVPYRTLLRIIERFPEDLFDEKVFSAPYLSLVLSDSQSTERARMESKDRIISFLKDALWILNQTSNSGTFKGKDELARCSHSISFLQREIID